MKAREAICHLQQADQICRHHLSASVEKQWLGIRLMACICCRSCGPRRIFTSNSTLLDSLESLLKTLGLVSSTSPVLCDGGLRITASRSFGVVVGFGAMGLLSGFRTSGPSTRFAFFFFFGVRIMYTYLIWKWVLFTGALGDEHFTASLYGWT
jgi:hypothetical protein